MEFRAQEMHRIVTTAIVYNDKHEFLITKRSMEKKAFPGQWTVPGGGLQVGDYYDEPANDQGVWYGALEQSLRREVREEVGVEIGRALYLMDMTLIRDDTPPTPVLVLSFYAPYVSGEVKLDADSTDFAWVSYEQAKGYDLIAGILGELEMADRLLKGEDPASVEYLGDNKGDR